MSIGMSTVAKWELVEEGMNWETIALPVPVTNSGAAPNNGFCMLHIWLMLVVDMVLYQSLAWYIEKVWPGTLGLPQPFYFLLLPSYWRGASADEAREELVDTVNPEQEDNKKLECFEAAPDQLQAVVQIRQLAKTFRGGKQALKGISLDMHKGTILGLLGHNGAGKSTTMSILMGLYPPSKGDVQVNGCSVRKDAHAVRKQLGICPQHNALWGMFTVEEHLTLFCNLKGVPRGEIRAEVDSLLADTGLTPKRHAAADALSGGMKRKLPLAWHWLESPQ